MHGEQRSEAQFTERSGAASPGCMGEQRNEAQFTERSGAASPLKYFIIKGIYNNENF